MTTIEKHIYSYEFDWGTSEMTEWITWRDGCIVSSKSKTKQTDLAGKSVMVYMAWDCIAGMNIIGFSIDENGQVLKLL